MAAVDYFLKLDGIPGESQDVQHKNEHQISSFSFGVENPTTIGSATGGAGAGKIKFNEFTIKKTADQASPVLFQSCAAGKHINSAVLTVRKAGGDPGATGTEFLKVKFSNVLISRYQDSATPALQPPATTPGNVIVSAPVDVIVVGPDQPVPVDSISMAYTKVQETVGAPQSISVQPTQGGMVTFDAATNTLRVSDAPGGVFTVGSAGGMSTLAVLEYDVGILIGLLTAPLSTASLNLNIELVPAVTPPPVDTVPGQGLVGAAQTQTTTPTPSGPKPPRFDVFLYTPADGVITLEDLTRDAQRIGTITVEPDTFPSFSFDLTGLIRRRHFDTFGIRLQPHGWSGPGDEGPEEEGTGDEGPEERPGPNQNFSASFTIGLSLDNQ